MASTNNDSTPRRASLPIIPPSLPSVSRSPTHYQHAETGHLGALLLSPPPLPHVSLSTPDSVPQNLTVGQKRTRNSTPVVQSPFPSDIDLSTNTNAVPPRPRRSWGRRSASWTLEEDARLVELVRKEMEGPPNSTGFKTWSRVAAQLHNRTGKQCRERYLNQLKPGIRRDPWSADEERILHDAHEKHGNKWVAIAAELPGRTDNCVKNHWNSMLRKRQRRESALRAAVREVNAALGAGGNGSAIIMTSSPTPRFGNPTAMETGERGSDADCSMHTGSVTPSGLSSMLDVQFSSGAPSPLAASSPITPKRDLKLQISSLISSHNGENDGSAGVNRWVYSGNTYFRDRAFSDRGGVQALPTADNHGVVSNGNFSRGYYNSHFDDAMDVNNRNGILNDRSVDVDGSCGGTDGRDSNEDSYNYERVSKRIEFGSDRVNHHQERVDVSQTRTTEGSTLGRTRFENNMTYNSNEAAGNNNLHCTVLDDVSNVKMRRLNERFHSPLAALAMAASAVPPSPLTPEPLFSGSCGSGSTSSVRRGLDQNGSHDEAIATNRVIWRTSDNDDATLTNVNGGRRMYADRPDEVEVTVTGVNGNM